MKSFLKRPLRLVAVLLVLAISAFATASTQTINVVTPFSLQESIPCANQGNGELVDFSGSLHQLFTSTVNGNVVHLTQISNPQGIKGVGETTGSVWNATGETRTDLTASVNMFPFEMTFVNNFKLINGQEGSLLIHENSQVTISAHGALAVSRDNFSIACK